MGSMWMAYKFTESPNAIEMGAELEGVLHFQYMTFLIARCE